jgi:hypothetical protein
MTTIGEQKRGIIYKLVCLDSEIKDTYVGSCICFRTRKTNHKSTCNNENNTKYHLNVYQFIRANGGWANWSMIQIETVNFTERWELRGRERYWLETLKATLNKKIPNRTQQEYDKIYRETNKTQISERLKENRIEINQKRKQVITCDCGRSSIKRQLARHKEGRFHKQYELDKSIDSASV